MNVFAEFAEHALPLGLLKCFDITLNHGLNDELVTTFRLPVNYTLAELENIIYQMKQHEYDDGFGTQYLFGTIWYEDGTYSTRLEYDGSECWKHHALPPIPDYLERNYVSSSSNS